MRIAMTILSALVLSSCSCGKKTPKKPDAPTAKVDLQVASEALRNNRLVKKQKLLVSNTFFKCHKALVGNGLAKDAATVVAIAGAKASAKGIVYDRLTVRIKDDVSTKEANAVLQKHHLRVAAHVAGNGLTILCSQSDARRSIGQLKNESIFALVQQTLVAASPDTKSP